MTDERPAIERWITRTFGDPETKRFGSGWMSGTSGMFLGFLAVLGVLAFRFPDLLSSPELRGRYSIPVLRALLETAIALAFVLGFISMLLRRRKALGATAVALAMGAALAGGGAIPIEGELDRQLTIGVDWFVLNVLLLALVFLPLERAFPRRPQQTTFRFGWTTDGTHFLVSHLALQILTFMTLLPSTAIAQLWQPEALSTTIGAQPMWLQFLEIVVLTDLVQYWVHRAFTSSTW